MSEILHKTEYNPENKTVSVVLIGAFNPLMFQPNWFSTNDIISQSEIDAVLSNKTNPCIITPNLAVFNTAQLHIQVQEDRFSVMGIKESFCMVKDVVKKTFERLGALSITAMGINTSAHFRMPSISKYHEFGDRLSPKGIWKDFLGDNVSGDDRTGGLVGMQMMNQKVDKSGSFNVNIERSVRFFPGIYINCNDHYQFDGNTDVETVMQKLEDNFDTSIKKSLEIQNSLFKDL
jgi:hypothetical protein